MEVNQNQRDKHCGYDTVEMNGIEKERLQPEIVSPSEHGGRRVRLHRKPLTAALLFVLFISCLALAIAYASSLYQLKNEKPPKVCLTTDCMRTASFILQNMNTSVDPCEDFFHYSCGGWINNNPIPAGRGVWGLDNIIWQNTLHVLKQIVEEDVERHTEVSSERKLKHLYRSCMNKVQIENAQAEPLMKIINRLQGWYGFENWDENKWDMLNALILLHGEYWNDPLFSFAVSVDLKDSDKHVVVIDQAGLGMMDKHFILGNDSDRVLDIFRKALGTVADLLGTTPQRRDQFVDDVIDFHLTLAKIHEPEEQRDDPYKLYNRRSTEELMQMAPEIDWSTFLGEIFPNMSTATVLIVQAPDYISNLSKVLETTPTRQLNNYIIWHAVEKYLEFLSINFRNVVEIIKDQLTGSRSSRNTVSAWEECVKRVDDNMGMALGALYVKRTFPESSKTKVENMIVNLKYALRHRFNTIDWLDERTKEKAQIKLDAVRDYIGYPDYILNDTLLDQEYEKFHIVEDNFFDNILSQNKYIYENFKQLLNEPVMKHGWQMTPPEINAYYAPNVNDIVFPAGLLQWPFFDPTYPKSINFGGIGSVIGHELSHGFDSYGSLFDEEGNMLDWWTHQTWMNFQHKSNCLRDLYADYELQGHRVNGEQTLDENIADIGGLAQAYQAYMLAVESEGEDLPLPGLNLTQTQTFFLAYSQYWCSARKPENFAAMIQFDVHSPEMFRVIGPLSQLKEFAEAYNCPVGSRMNPVDRCDGIWW